MVVIYHSLGLLKVIDLFDKKKKRFILEMEEIYADVIGKTKLRKKEIAAAHKANGYIFPTRMLNSEINNTNKRISIPINEKDQYIVIPYYLNDGEEIIGTPKKVILR